MGVALVFGVGMFVLMAILNAKLEQTQAGAAKKSETQAGDTPASFPAGKASVSVQYCGA